MKQRPRILHGKPESADVERWQKGESLQQIASCLIETTHRTTHSGRDGAEYVRRNGPVPDWR